MTLNINNKFPIKTGMFEMKDIIVDVEKIDFDRFVDKVRSMRRGAIASIEKIGDYPDYCFDNTSRDFQQELKDGLLVFFPFSGSNFGEPISCVDGIERDYQTMAEEEETDLCLGFSDAVGYVFELKNNKFIIKSATDAGVMSPSVDLEEDCFIFDEPMKKFIESFIKK